MDYFTFRNTAILGLVQVGLIVVGILGAGTTIKFHRTYEVQPPAATALVADSGHFALAVPVVWVAWAMWLLWAGECDEMARVCLFYAGILLVAVLVFAIVSTVASPLLQLLGGCCSLGSE